MTLINPNQLFDTAREDPDHLPEFWSVLHSGFLFRHREDGAESPSIRAEAALSQRVEREAAILVVNGTFGLELALRTIGVRPGDRVGVCAFSFIACSMAVVNVGAIPVPIDISPDLEMAEPADGRASELAAALVVHIQGHAMDADRFISWCDERSIPIVEDICQAFGALDAVGRPAGRRGRIAVTSFQQSKQLSAGEGGAIIGDHDDIAAARAAADLGALRRPNGLPDWDDPRARFGTNGRLGDLQAALVLDQLNQLDSTLTRQRANRALLWDEAPAICDRSLSAALPGAATGSHTLLLANSAEDARAFVGELASANVHARVVWGRPFPDYGVYRARPDAHQTVARYDGAADVAPRVVSIPTPKYLTEDDLHYIASVVTAAQGRIADVVVEHA